MKLPGPFPRPTAPTASNAPIAATHRYRLARIPRLQYSILLGGLGAVLLALGGWQLPSGLVGFFRLGAGASPRLIAPNGQPITLRAVSHVHLISPSAPRTDLAPAYVDERSQAIVANLRQWGFNALGGDVDADLWHRGLPFIQSLDLAQHLQAEQQTALFDVYAPGFPAQVQALAQAACAPALNENQLIGYVSDQGLTWDPARHAAEVLTFYLQLPVGAPGRRRAEDYLRVRYGSNIKRLNQAWGGKAQDFISLTLPAANAAAFAADAAPFARQVLVRYLQQAANAIHAADPNHLYLGAELDPSGGGPEWAIPDVDSVRLSPAQDPAPVIATLPKPVLAIEEGCGTVAAATQSLLDNSKVVGYVWSPGGDWQSGACALQAAQAWVGINHGAGRP